MNVRLFEKSDEVLVDAVRRTADAFALALNTALNHGLVADATIQHFHTAGEKRTSRIAVMTSVSRPAGAQQ